MVNIRNSATMTPAGFPWYDQWGSARYASNNAFLHAVDYSEPFSRVISHSDSQLPRNGSISWRVTCDVNQIVKLDYS